MQLHLKPTIARRVDVLEVRFSPPPPKPLPKLDKHLLTREINTQFKVTQVTVQHAPEIAPPPSLPITEPTATTTQGIAMTGAITMPWQLPGRSNNSPFHPPSAQQNAEQNYYQQAMQAQARQRNEDQSRQRIQQLQQLLTNILDVKPAVSGKCSLDNAAAGAQLQLKCNSPALYEVISKNQMDLVGMLVALRSMGRLINGFSVEPQAEKLHIFLTKDVQASDTRQPN